jgi:1,4-alpha-glucan branching enzyme
MVDALHQQGIAVLLDIVWNHFSYTDNFLWNYDGTQIYFDNPAIGTPWGDQADFDRADVRDYFANSGLYWLEDFKIDGFRMDATSYMNIYPQNASGWSLMQRLNDEMDNRWIDKIAIAEQLPDNSWITRPASLGGAGFDSQYHDQFTDRLRDEIFDAAFGNPEMWKIRNILNGSGDYLQGRHVVNYFELHDEAWPSSGGQRIVKTIDPTVPHDDMWAKGRVKLAQGVVLTAPGIPAILMGTEWLEDTDFGTDSGNRIDWSKKTTYAEIFQYFQDLISLRRQNSALRADAGHQVFHLNESANVIAWQRWSSAGDVLVLCANFSNTDYTDYRIGLPQPGDWLEVLNSQADEYDGSGLTNPGEITAEAFPYNGFDQSAVFLVPKMGFMVLSLSQAVPVPQEPINPLKPKLLGAYPNPFNPQTRLVYSLPAPMSVHLMIYDVSGRRVGVLKSGVVEAAGRHEITWNGQDTQGRTAPSGVYFYRLHAGGHVETKRMVLIR